MQQENRDSAAILHNLKPKLLTHTEFFLSKTPTRLQIIYYEYPLESGSQLQFFSFYSSQVSNIQYCMARLPSTKIKNEGIFVFCLFIINKQLRSQKQHERTETNSFVYKTTRNDQLCI